MVGGAEVAVRDARGWWQAAGAVLLAGVLLGLATAAGPFFVSSAGTAMLAAELEATGEDVTMLGVHVSGTLGAEDLAEADRLLTNHLDRQGLPTPVRQLVIEVVTVDGTRLNLIGRGAAALDQLPPVVEDADGAAAAPASSAARLGVGAGDEVVVTAPAADGEVSIPVGPVVADFDRGEMPPAWRPVTGLLTATDDPRIPPPPPALLVDDEQALALLGALGHDIGDDGVATGNLVQASWTVDLEGAPTLEQAHDLVPRLEAVRVAIADPTTEVGGSLHLPGSWPPTVGGARLDAAVGRVAAAADELAVPVRLLGLTGQLLALGGVAAAVVLGGRRRLSRARLWSVRGVPATTLALRWAVTAAAPLATGALAGSAIADRLTRQLGPSGAVDASVRTGMWWQLAVAVGAALVVVAVTAGVAIRVQAHGTSAPQRVPPIAEVLAVVLAGIALWQADARGGVVTMGADGTLELDPLAVALPILLVVAAAAVGARLLAPLLRVLGRTPGRQPAWFLASRRLRTFGGTAMALAFITASAVGLLVLATTLQVSSEATVEEKAGLTMGADAVIALSRSSVSEGLDPSTVPTPTTTVRRAPDLLLDDGTVVDVLAIDPDSFADVAYRPRYLADVDVAELSSRLSDTPAGTPRPAIAVGTTLDAVTTVRIGDVELSVEEVGTAPVFPGAGADHPTLVVADGGPLAPDDPAVTARLAFAVIPELWVDAGDLDPASFRVVLDEVEHPSGAFGTAGSAPPSHFEYAADLRDDPGVAPATWTFTFLRAQATVVAIIGLLALLGHHVVRQRRQALGTDLASRMGLRRRARTMAELIELAALAAIALALGAASGVAAARTVVTSYDPVPEVALPVVFRLPVDALSAPLLAVAVAVVVAAVITMRAVDRVDVATLLRSGG